MAKSFVSHSTELFEDEGIKVKKISSSVGDWQYTVHFGDTSVFLTYEGLRILCSAVSAEVEKDSDEIV